jgi:uncharacterized protein YpuA (DUF1002 family)
MYIGCFKVFHISNYMPFNKLADCVDVLQVQNMLQQLQDKFQSTSDQVLSRNILSALIL